MDIPTLPDLQATFDRERQEARAAGSANLVDARSRTIRMYDRLAAAQSSVIEQTRVELACAKGCAYCCHLRVEIRPHDAFVLAQQMRARFSGEQLDKAIERLASTVARIGVLTPEQHVRAGIPCALLENGACSVYEGRPATCRKYYSVSVDTCRSAFEDTSAPLVGQIQDEATRLAGNAVALGYAKGLEDAGYDAALYELNFAVHTALTQPKAEKRYRQGKRAFVAKP